MFNKFDKILPPEFTKWWVASNINMLNKYWMSSYGKNKTYLQSKGKQANTNVIMMACVDEGVSGAKKKI